jgi:catechol 2,3-dioxygenase-like lactoylglutathione lyase family enzyme
MNLVSVRIITDNVEGLVRFYEQVTGMPAVQYTPDFAELQSRSANLAIGSTNTLQFFGGEEVAKAAENHTAIIEFRVDDVENDYKRLTDLLQTCLVQTHNNALG